MARTSLLTTVSALVLIGFAPQSAHAQCVVDGGGDAGAPMSGATINCTSNLETTGILGPMASGVTVNVQAPAGGISVTGDQAILLGDDATIDISAMSNRPVQTSGDTAGAIDIGNGGTVNVGGLVSTSGEASPAIRTGDGAMVMVEGTVTTGGGMSDAINVGAMSTVTIGSMANVNSQNSNSGAVVLRGDNSTLIVESEDTAMNGLQQGLVTTSSGNSNPVRIEGNMGTVEVAGEVRSSSGDATAILAEGDMATITVLDRGEVSATSSNSNAIESTGSGAMIRVESGGSVSISSGNSIGIVSGTNATVGIAGTVSASSSDSSGVELGNMSELTVESGGLIETSSSESQAVLIGADAMTATVTVDRGGDIDAVGAQAIVDEGETNSTINVDGIVFGGASDPVLDLRGGNDTVIVNGTVRGTSANPVISLGAGDDSTTINSSETVEGPGVLVDGGDGNDTVNLASGQSFRSSQFSGVETTNTGRNATMGDPNEGMETSIEVDDDQSGGAFNADEGGMVRVSNGGSAGSVNANNGGQAMVSNGGNAGRVSSGMGSNVTVESGGTAGVDSGSGMGGSIDFQPGSTASVNGMAQGGTQSITVSGANFQPGSQVAVGNSSVLRGSAAGDRVDLTLDGDAFENAGGSAGDSGASFGAAVDRAIAAGDADATQLIVDEDLLDTIERGGGQDRAQIASTGVAAVLGFGDVLSARTGPSLGGGVAVASGAVVSTRGFAAEQSIAWVEAFGGRFDVDAGATSAFDGSYGGLALGVERQFGWGALGEGTIGVAFSITSGSTDSGVQDGDFDAYSVGLYGNAINGPAQVSGHLAYTALDFDIGGDDSGDGDLFSGRVEYAYNLRGRYDGPVLLAPYAALGFVSGTIDGGATPTGSLDDGDIDQGIAEIGLRLGRSYTVGGRPSRGLVEVGYQRVFGDEGVTFDGTAFGQGFTTSSSSLGRDRATLGAAWETEISENATFSVRYDGTFGDGSDHSVGVHFGMRF